MARKQKYTRKVEKIAKGVEIEWEERNGPDWWLISVFSSCVGAWLLQSLFDGGALRWLTVIVATLLTIYAVYAMIGTLLLKFTPHLVRRLVRWIDQPDKNEKSP